MASSTSEPYFWVLAKGAGLDGAAIDKLKELGITTANKQFMTGHMPGQGKEDIFKSDVVTPVLGEDAAASQIAALRQLFTEAYAIALEELRRRTERSDNDLPRKVPHAERFARIEHLKKRLPGVPLHGEYEPSSHLIDVCIQQCQDLCLAYVRWGECTSRQQEVLHVKKDPTLLMNGSGLSCLI